MSRKLIPSVRVSRFGSHKSMGSSDQIVHPRYGFPLEMVYEFSGTTTDSTNTVLTLDHASQSVIEMDADQAAHASAFIVARVTDVSFTGTTLAIAENDAAALYLTGLINRGSAASSITIVDSTMTERHASTGLTGLLNADYEALYFASGVAGFRVLAAGIDDVTIDWKAKLVITFV